MLRESNSSPSKGTLLKWINETSFALDDTLLYLDTHPGDQEALRYFRQNMEHRNDLVRQYTSKFGPLLLENYPEQGTSDWLWQEQPFPWELEGGVK